MEGKGITEKQAQIGEYENMTNEWNQEFQEKRISRNDEQTTTKKSQRKNEGMVERFIEASETGLQTCSHNYYYYNNKINQGLKVTIKLRLKTRLQVRKKKKKG